MASVRPQTAARAVSLRATVVRSTLVRLRAAAQVRVRVRADGGTAAGGSLAEPAAAGVQAPPSRASHVTGDPTPTHKGRCIHIEELCTLLCCLINISPGPNDKKRNRATHAHPTSPRSTGFCAIWDCIVRVQNEIDHGKKIKMKYYYSSYINSTTLRVARCSGQGTWCACPRIASPSASCSPGSESPASPAAKR